MFFKKLTYPKSNETRQVDAVQMWEVRWISRYGEYYGNTRKELECFTSEQLANEFAQALRAAFHLVRHTAGNTVSVFKAA